MCDIKGFGAISCHDTKNQKRGRISQDTGRNRKRTERAVSGWPIAHGMAAIGNGNVRAPKDPCHPAAGRRHGTLVSQAGPTVSDADQQGSADVLSGHYQRRDSNRGKSRRGSGETGGLSCRDAREVEAVRTKVWFAAL